MSKENNSNNKLQAKVVYYASGKVGLKFCGLSNIDAFKRFLSDFQSFPSVIVNSRLISTNPNITRSTMGSILIQPAVKFGQFGLSDSIYSHEEANSIRKAVDIIVTAYNKTLAPKPVTAKRKFTVLNEVKKIIEDFDTSHETTSGPQTQDEKVKDALRNLQKVAHLPESVIQSLEHQIFKKVCVQFNSEEMPNCPTHQSNYVVRVNLGEGIAAITKSRTVARLELSSTQGRVLNTVNKFFTLSHEQSRQVKNLVESFQKLEFEDGARYEHVSGKYKYLGVLQPNGAVKILNMTRGGTVSSLNDDPHNALSKGIIKKITS